MDGLLHSSAFLLRALTALRNQPECPPPIPAASYFLHAFDRLKSFPSNARTRPLNVCTQAPDSEMPRFPNTAMHLKASNKPDRLLPTSCRAPQIFPAQMWPVQANNPNRIRSCLCPDRFPYKF